MGGDYRSRGCFTHRSDLLLEQGNIYFSVRFVDEDMLIPIMETWVFAEEIAIRWAVKTRCRFNIASSSAAPVG
jgi:hypothetical protein